jgi:hypothetical protein
MRVFSILAVCGIAAGSGLSGAPRGAYGTGSRLESIVRTVYVTVTDGQGATMNVVSISTNQATGGVGSLADESNREQVLGDGAKQPGGRRVTISAGVNLPKALADGVKPDRRLNVSLKRRGVSVRAPSLVPDR